MAAFSQGRISRLTRMTGRAGKGVLHIELIRMIDHDLGDRHPTPRTVVMRVQMPSARFKLAFAVHAEDGFARVTSSTTQEAVRILHQIVAALAYKQKLIFVPWWEFTKHSQKQPPETASPKDLH